MTKEGEKDVAGFKSIFQDLRLKIIDGDDTENGLTADTAVELAFELVHAHLAREVDLDRAGEQRRRLRAPEVVLEDVLEPARDAIGDRDRGALGQVHADHHLGCPARAGVHDHRL